VGAVTDGPAGWRLQDEIEGAEHVRGKSFAEALASLLVPKDTLSEVSARRALESVRFPTCGHDGPAARLRSP
jgi:hypothetical protein